MENKNYPFVVLLVLCCSCGISTSRDQTNSSENPAISDNFQTEGQNKDSLEWVKKLDGFLADYKKVSNTLPSVSYSWSNESNASTTLYYFSEGKLSWVQVHKSGLGAYEHNYYYNLETEWYLHYGTDGAGFFSILDERGEGKWISILSDSSGQPLVSGFVEWEPVFPYIEEYIDHMNFIADNISRFDQSHYYSFDAIGADDNEEDGVNITQYYIVVKSLVQDGRFIIEVN